VELGEKIFEELGGYDLVPNTAMSAKSPFTPDTYFLFSPIKNLQPGKDLPPDSIPQALELELMKPEDYDYIIKNGWFKYAKEYIKPQLGTSQPPFEPDPTRSFFEEKGAFTLSEYSSARIMAPFNVLSAARSMDKFLIDLYRHPDQVKAALDVVTDETIDMILQDYEDQTNKPALWMWGGRESSGFISPKQFVRFALPSYKKILEACMKRGALVQLHFDQNWTGFLPYLREFPEGKYILQLDGMTDIFKAKEILGDRMCIMGDVPASLLKLGTPKEVEAYCRKLIDIVGKGSGFILSSGCDVPHDAKFENVKAMVDTARNYPPPGA
jgi:hypothetical protein